MTTKLRSIRYQRGETQRDIATALGCTTQAVGSWESGEHRPKPSMAKKLSDRFGIPVAELLAPEAAA